MNQANLESLNAHLINEQIPPHQRILKLNKTAINQMKTLLQNTRLQRIMAGKHIQKNQ